MVKLSQVLVVVVVATVAVFFGREVSRERVTTLGRHEQAAAWQMSGDEQLRYFYEQAQVWTSNASEVTAAGWPLICCNVNLDLVVDGVALVRALLADETGEQQPADAEQIASVEEFVAAFLYYFGHGSAAERFVTSAATFERILHQVAAHSDAVSPRYYVGGNAALMANHLASVGYAPRLFGPIGARVADPANGFLHSAVQVHSSSSSPADEVHLILEYGRGDAVQLSGGHKLVSPRANRFIVSHDVSNMQLAGLAAVDAALRSSAEPPLLVLSGTHLIEGMRTSPAQQRSVVAQLRDVVDVQQRSGVVHLELASVGDAGTLRLLADELVWTVDSLGLNEQELGALYAAVGGGEHSLASFKAPTLQTSVDALLHVVDWAQRRARAAGRQRLLTRVHMHFLSYHIICADQSRWRDAAVRRAVQSGAVTATVKACGPPDQPGQLPDADQLELHWTSLLSASLLSSIDHSRHADPSCLDLRPAPHLFCSVYPVLVCKKPLRTVGLGDAISSRSIVDQLLSEKNSNSD